MRLRVPAGRQGPSKCVEIVDDVSVVTPVPRLLANASRKVLNAVTFRARRAMTAACSCMYDCNDLPSAFAVSRSA